MISKKKLLKKSLLYLILDKETAGQKDLPDIALQVKDSGVGIIQFRDKFSCKSSILKDAFSLRRSLRGSKVIFIINDYLDVAKIVDSDGLHLGQLDLSIEIVRRVLGKDKIIGVSCHNLRQALTAQEKGADYIGIGPLFSTPTKPQYRPIGLKLIRELNNKIRIPFFVIGDVNLGNLGKIISSGAKRVAVCRAILKSNNISFAAKSFCKTLHQ